MNCFHDLVIHRRSYRKYTDELLNPEQVRLILEAGQDRPEKKASVQENAETINRYTHLRGPAYYGGGKNE